VRLLLAAGLVLATVALFAPVRGYGFVDYDDNVYVTQNPHLAAGLSQEGLRWAVGPYETNWIPLTWTSLLVDHALYGLDPGGYHLTNLALHVASVLVLFWTLSAMTGAPGRSAFVAAVFAWHPLHVESVAWVAERKDVLAGLFWMLALAAWTGYARRPGVLRYAGVVGLLAIGLLAKALAVTLPFALLLLDLWPLGRLTDAAGRLEGARVRRAVLEKLPMLPIVAAVSAVTWIVQLDRGAMSSLELIPLPLRLENAAVSCVAYLRDAFWPRGLAAFYPYPDAVPAARWLGAAVLLAAMTAVALASWRRRPWLTVGWLWYLGTLVPMIGLVQVGMQSRADRYTYVPLIGIAILVAWGAEALRERLRAPPGLGVAVGAAAAAAMAVLTTRQLETWRDSDHLFGHAIDVTRDNFVALHGLGTVRLLRGDAAGALPLLAEAVRLKPHWAGARADLADDLAHQGRLDDAIGNFQEAVRQRPDDPTLQARFAAVLVQRGWLDEAITHYETAVRLDAAARDGAEAARYEALEAAAWSARGDPARAVAHYEKALALDPTLVEARANLALERLHAGDPSAAASGLEAALRAGADQPEVHVGLGDALAALGREAEAAAQYRAALVERPRWAQAANNLAWLLATARDDAVRAPEEAVRWARVAADASGRRDPRILDTLATSLAGAGDRNEALRAADEAVARAEAEGDTSLAASLRAHRATLAAAAPAPPAGGPRAAGQREPSEPATRP
jgi:tetratricopeptide (TPR) repeat protein